MPKNSLPPSASTTLPAILYACTYADIILEDYSFSHTSNAISQISFSDRTYLPAVVVLLFPTVKYSSFDGSAAVFVRVGISTVNAVTDRSVPCGGRGAVSSPIYSSRCY